MLQKEENIININDNDIQKNSQPQIINLFINFSSSYLNFFLSQK